MNALWEEKKLKISIFYYSKLPTYSSQDIWAFRRSFWYFCVVEMSSIFIFISHLTNIYYLNSQHNWNHRGFMHYILWFLWFFFLHFLFVAVGVMHKLCSRSASKESMYSRENNWKIPKKTIKKKQAIDTKKREKARERALAGLDT